MRIAYVCSDPGVPVFGRKGCSVHVQEVLRALLRRGHIVELFARRLDGPPPCGLEMMRTHQLSSAPKGDIAFRERQLLRANVPLRRTLEYHGPFDLVYERYSLWSDAGMEYAHAAGTPGLLEINAPLVEEQKLRRSLSDETTARSVAQRTFEAASALLPVSLELADYLMRQGVDAHRLHVTPNGVDPERFADASPALARPPGSFTIGFLGTLKPWHGLETLAEAFLLLHRYDPAYRLLVVGDGPERDALAHDLASRGAVTPDAVHFAGAVSPEEVPHWLASMDAATAPYPDLAEFYFSPLKVYEYMAAGLPVVASGIGQVKKLIQQGVNGVLTPPGDAAALAAALERLRNDQPLRERLGRTARNEVLREHTWDAVAGRILDLATAHSRCLEAGAERR